jgi:hypothetical protein
MNKKIPETTQSNRLLNKLNPKETKFTSNPFTNKTSNKTNHGSKTKTVPKARFGFSYASITAFLGLKKTFNTFMLHTFDLNY